MPLLPGLPELQRPLGRRVIRWFLKGANGAFLIIGIFTNMLSLEINPDPTFCPGMLMMFLGLTMMLGAVLGFGSYESPFYYKSHVITMSMATFGTAILSLVMISQRSMVAASFKSPRYSNDTMDEYLASVSWVYAFVAGFEGAALLARVLYQRMVAHEHYENLAEAEDNQSVALGNMDVFNRVYRST